MSNEVQLLKLNPSLYLSFSAFLFRDPPPLDIKMNDSLMHNNNEAHYYIAHQNLNNFNTLPSYESQ